MAIWPPVPPWALAAFLFPGAAMGKQKAKTIKALADLTPDPCNANKGTERGQGLLDNSLREYGAGRSILADRNGVIIAGNKTLARAADIGLPVRVVPTDGSELVVVQRTDLDLARDKRAKELAIADNRVAQIDLEWDGDVLKALADEIDLTAFFDQDELAGIVGQAEGSGGEDPGADTDRAAELQAKWQTAVGQLWQVGHHRLLVGDCTVRENVERLMGGERAVLFETDPQYGVNYDSAELHRNGSHYDAIQQDDFQDEKLQAFLESAFGLWADVALVDNAAWYLWHAMLTQGFFAAAAAAAAAAVKLHRQIIWVKPQFVFGRGDYHWQHEICFYGWRKGKRPAFYGERNQTTVWEIGYGGKRNNRLHPTEKPPELWHAPMKNHTKPGEICAEPFAGSGSQYVAGEQLGRRVFGMEIEPKYAAVILERLALLGLDAHKVD